jgi:L-iditol 2-dehydrogenase
VGSQETISQAISVARKGSKIIIVGVFGEKPVADLGLVQDRELSLIGTLMYQKNDFLKGIELLKEGRLQLKRLITDRFSFSDFMEAYKYILDKKDKIMKVMISLD